MLEIYKIWSMWGGVWGLVGGGGGRKNPSNAVDMYSLWHPLFSRQHPSMCLFCPGPKVDPQPRKWHAHLKHMRAHAHRL